MLIIASKDQASAKSTVRRALGPTIEDQASFSMSVRAQLTGVEDDARIQALDPPSKSLSLGNNTSWEWYITPRTTEPFNLELTLFNQYEVNGKVFEEPGATYTVKYRVQATLWQTFKRWLGELAPYQGLIGLSIAGIIGWLFTWVRARYFPKLAGAPDPSTAPETGRTAPTQKTPARPSAKPTTPRPRDPAKARNTKTAPSPTRKI